MAKQTAWRPQSYSAPLTFAPTHRFFPLLLVLFVGSGCAALIYEIVWFQLLELVIGSSAISLGVLLGTFMGGMCRGSSHRINIHSECTRFSRRESVRSD